MSKFFKKHFKKFNPRAVKLGHVGLDMISIFSTAMEKEGIDWWLEFGSLLGMYRDHDFIKGDYDVDFGAWLDDAPRITEALLASGCKIRREYHVVGGLGMEQTFRTPQGLNFDVFYLYPSGDCLIGTGFKHYKKGLSRKAPRFFFVHEFTFKPFATVEGEFKGMKVRIPANTEEHIIEVYGPGYKVYDPLFKDGFNKKKYPITEKVGIGFKHGLDGLR